MINRSWKYERLLLFAHVFLTNTLGFHRARDIRSIITRRMDLWERVLGILFMIPNARFL